MGSISRKAGTTMLHAPRTANACGRPFNTFVTIRFWQLGSTAESLEADFRRLRAEWFQRWSSRPSIRAGQVHQPRNGPPTYSFVHENQSGRPHTHWAVHVLPENRERFIRALERRICRQFGLSALPVGALSVDEVHNAEGLKLYMTKTLDPHYGRMWGIRTEDGGEIRGRRADSSRNLGPSTWRPLKAAYRAGTRSG